MLGISALAQLALAEFPQVTLVPAPVVIVDTHDGVKKKKKKKPQDFSEEVERREQLRKQITEVIHPPVLVPVEEPETTPVPEVVEAKPFGIKTTVTPEINYADLARQEIVDKIRLNTELKAKQLQERLQAEIDEDEEELEMILDSIL